MTSDYQDPQRILYCKVVFLLILFFSVNITTLAQVSSDYRTQCSGDWSHANTWEKYNGTAWVDTSVAPSIINSTVTILDEHTVNWNATGTLSVPLLILKGKGNLVIAAGKALYINSGSVVRLDGSGRIGAERSNASINFTDGSVCELTSSPNITTLSAVAIPVANWNRNATLKFLNPGGLIAYRNLNQSFGNVEYNRAGQTENQSDFRITKIKGDFTVNSTGISALIINNTSKPHLVDVGGNFTLNGGDFQLCSTTKRIAYLHFKGNMYLNGGNMVGIYGAVSGFYFVGTGEQSFESSIVLNRATNQRFFYKNSGPNRKINQVYQGNLTAQQTIYGYASPRGYSPIQSSATVLKNITINNPAGVALTTSQTINENLYLVNGTFNTDKTIRQTLTMPNSNMIERTGGSLTTVPTFSDVGGVVYNAYHDVLTFGAKFQNLEYQIQNGNWRISQ
jgi:hypothetical protein